MIARRVPPARARAYALAAALLLTPAIAVLDRATGFEVSVLALYLVPPAISGWYAGRRWGAAVAVLAAATWLWADVAAGQPYSNPAFAYWNAVPRLAIFAAFGILAGELRSARARAARPPDEEGLPAAGSFYRMLDQEYARMLRYGRPVTLAYVDAGHVRGEPGGASELFSDAVLETLQGTLRGSDVVARPRGREFALLLADTGPEAASVALERLRGRLAGLAQRHGGGASITVGAVSCTGPAAELNHVIQRAYQLMYQADRTPGQAAVTIESVGDAQPAHSAP